jgi:imidazolonepropionase-like amidohydrolase
MLRRGFTTVRDAGGADHGLAQAIDRGLIRGPRLFYSGRVLSQTGGHGDFRPLDHHPTLCACQIHSSAFAHVADGVDAVRRAAREELRRGASQVKVMASGGVASPSDPIWVVQYSEEEIAAAVAEARSWRTYVLAHAYTPEAIERAVRAGVRSIEHGNLIDEPTARLMAERGAYLVPTLVTYVKIAELGAAFGFPEASIRKVSDVIDHGLRSLEIASRAGVAIGFGTDLLGETHPFQSHEFVIRAQAMKPIDVIRSATVVNAAILQRPGELGVVKPGALADLVAVDGDPLADISLLDGQGEHLALVMRGGVVMHRRGV